MDNFELFLDQVKILEEIEKRRRRRFYALTAAFFIAILGILYVIFF